MPTRFSPRRPFIKATGTALMEENFFSLKGLNMYSPDEQLDPQESPYAHDFRFYSPRDTTKRVAITKRKGFTRYSVPVGETTDSTLTTTTGAADQTVSLTAWKAMKFTTTTGLNLSRVDLNLKNNNSGTGNLIVTIQSDSSGPSGTILATTSIKNSDITGSYTYVPAYFIEAPALTGSTNYWIVCYIQGDGTNDYKWSSTTASTLAMTSTSGTSWSAATYSLNFKVYSATAGPVKGMVRYYKAAANPQTVFAHTTQVYTVNDSTGAVTSIKSGLTSGATFYDFAEVNNVLYWVNGQDAPQQYDGTTVSDAGGSPPISSAIELHANRLFYLSADIPNKLVFTEAGDYSTIASTNFLYVPSPNTVDPVVNIFSFQGNLLCFTRNTKYNLYGTDLTSFVLREATAKKGAINGGAITTDGSYIYFLSDDGIYRYNGGTDQLLSRKVEPLLATIANSSTVRLTVQNNKLYVYYASTGQTTNNNCLVYDITYGQWAWDTNVYVRRGLGLRSQSDSNQFVASSSVIGALYYADSGTSDLGKPIAFEYRTKYHTFDHPSAKHRVKRYYPHLQGQDGNWSVDCQVDVDEANSPTSHSVNVNTAAHTWGDGGNWGSVANGGSGYNWGNSVLSITRITIGGNNLKHQFRFVQSGADNPVDILGYTVYLKLRRPV